MSARNTVGRLDVDMMAKKRDPIPRSVRDTVLKEFNHRCAKCGGDGPQIHHIDENPSNNDQLNLIPLCPNCHLVDQHDASNAVPQAKLRLFRRYKHRSILTPQFNPLHGRALFLSAIQDSDDAGHLEQQAKDLVAFVRCLAMGEFYSKQLEQLLAREFSPHAWVVGDPDSETRVSAELRKEDQEYRDQLRSVAPDVESLIVELLDYQAWR